MKPKTLGLTCLCPLSGGWLKWGAAWLLPPCYWEKFSVRFYVNYKGTKLKKLLQMKGYFENKI